MKATGKALCFSSQQRYMHQNYYLIYKVHYNDSPLAQFISSFEKCEEPNDMEVITDQTCCSIGNITGLFCVVFPDPVFCLTDLLGVCISSSSLVACSAQQF